MQQYSYEIFTSVIEEQIKNETFRNGDRLPSVRAIKEKYHISVSSVQSGYEYLMLKGLVKSNPRSGYFVDYQNDKIPKAETKLLPVSKDVAFSKNVLLTSARDKPSAINSFNNTAPGDFLVPQKLILRTMQEVIREKGSALLRYYPPNGSFELRNLIADRMNKLNCSMNAEEIIITDGTLQALFIALHTVTKEGDVIAIESPCVFSVLEVAANLNLKIIEIPVNYQDGFDIEYLKKVCETNTIKALVVTPNFHNPTGILMKEETKKDLAELAENFQFPIIENDIYGDIYFSEKRPTCIKSFDQKGWVITVSSFSKTLAPGIRLGWLNAGKFYAQAEKSKFSLGRTVSPIYQELMIKLLIKNSYDRHLRSFRKKLNQQAMLLLNTLRTYFPKDSYFHQPEGGYSIWGELPERIDMDKFYEYCEKNRILFTPGNTFSVSGEYKRCFRIVFAEYMNTESLELIKKAGEKARELWVEI